jgi:hypothetical protein
MNFAHGVFALALTYQAQGKPDQTREIIQTVVHDSIESNNIEKRTPRVFSRGVGRRERKTGGNRWCSYYMGRFEVFEE